MNHILINYSVKEEWAAYNRKLIEDFIQQLRDYPVPGISYSAYKIGKASFIHICHYSTAPLCEEVTNRPTFKHFLKTLENIVDQEPIVNDIKEIGYFSK